MLSTKEYFKQIEMDTIQQEPLLTELTSEAAATVEGGFRLFFEVKVKSGRLNVRSAPSLGNNIIGHLTKGRIVEATDEIISSGAEAFRKLTVPEAIAATGQAVAWVADRYLKKLY